VKTELINFRLPEDIAAALKRAASEDLRSINAQGLFYIRSGLLAEGRYHAGNGSAAEPVARLVAVPAPVTVLTPAPDRPAAAPKTDLETQTEMQARGVVATINEELRQEGHRPLTGNTHGELGDLLSTAFKDVRDLAAAREKGATKWLSAGAKPGLIHALFPDDRGAVEMAKKAQNAVWMKRRHDLASDLQRFIYDKGILGRGATALRRILDQRFPGMTPEEAVKQGAEAWLDAGVGEEVARKLFDKRTADEARRRATARANAKKKTARIAAMAR
jgi:hypothetical protein